jgi:endonuclease/exonuclease/phosphatase family metal-dependent hydrolase
MPLKILSFNIHGGYDRYGVRDLSRVHALLDHFDVDIAVFQEMETRHKRQGTENDIDQLAGSKRPHRLIGATIQDETGWYGNLIVSRYPIVRGDVHNLETRKILEPRNAVDALIDSPLGPIRVIGTHLSLISSERWFEINNLIRLMEKIDHETKVPHFLVGDINEWRWRSKLIGHMDSLMTPLSCGKSFPSRFPLFRLDRVWYDPPELAVSARVLKGDGINTLSDHLPVLIEVEITNEVFSERSMV